MAKDAHAKYVAAKAKLVSTGNAYHVALAEFISLSKDENPDQLAARIKADQTSWPGIPSFTAVTPGAAAVNGKKRASPPSDTEDEVDDLTTASGKKPRAKKVKKEKDPNAPKRPPSAFIMFQNSVRAEIKDQNPEIDHRGLAKLIGERWAAMAEAEKDPWTKAGKEAMATWSADKKAYDAANPGAKVATRVSPDATAAAAGPAAVVTAADGTEKPKKKRGRPSNAELAKRAEAAAKEAEEAEAGKKKEKKEKKVAKPAAPSTGTVPSSPKKSSAPAPVESSDESSDDSSDESDSDAPVVTKKNVKKAAAAESSDDSSSDVSDSSEEDVPAARPAPSPAKAPKVKSSEKKVRK